MPRGGGKLRLYRRKVRVRATRVKEPARKPAFGPPSIDVYALGRRPLQRCPRKALVERLGYANGFADACESSESPWLRSG